VTAYLYYAGMAGDRTTEQIGLATSDNGRDFRRVNRDGLILPIDAAVRWRSVRTCNPTVLKVGAEWWMFYQGVGPDASGAQLTHVIALARSSDAVTWSVEPRPVLTFAHVRAQCPGMSDGADGGVIEPAVIADGKELHMYFVAYRGHYSQGTVLYHARSADGEQWQIDPSWVLARHQFGNFRLHYPQARHEADRKVIWFSLIERATAASAIVQMTAIGNDPWGETRQLLPFHGPGLRVEPAELIGLRFGGQRVRGSDRVNQALAQWTHGGRHYLGYSHPHAIDGRLYYHAYHRSRQGHSWMDIGACRYADNNASEHDVVLRPSSAAGAWDAFFVADPFVINL